MSMPMRSAPAGRLAVSAVRGDSARTARHSCAPPVKRHAAATCVRVSGRAGGYGKPNDVPLERAGRPSWALGAVKSGSDAERALGAKEMDQIASISEAARAAVEQSLDREQPPPKLAGAPQSDLRAKVEAMCIGLEEGLVEREAEVRLLVLAALCGEHVLFLGPPGTAKSELGRRLGRATGGRYFERLLTRFSVPEELFGPLSMQGLEEDRYERQTEGYLPTAEVAFIDEVFKANSAILNALLTLLNERLFDNGSARVAAPLVTLVGASNEGPESEELDALYDRFLIRTSVDPVSSSGLRRLGALVAAGAAGAAGAPAAAAVSPAELAEAREVARKVAVPRAVIDLLVDLRDHLRDQAEPPVYVSDRRFAHTVSMLQVAAHACGAAEVSEYDLLLLEFVFSAQPSDRGKVRRWVLDALSQDPGRLQAELSLIGLYGRAARALAASGAGEELEGLEEEACQLVDALATRCNRLDATVEGEFPLLQQNLWLPAESVLAASETLAPRLRDAQGKCEGLLADAAVLLETLRARGSPGVLKSLLPRVDRQYAKMQAGGQQ